MQLPAQVAHVDVEVVSLAPPFAAGDLALNLFAPDDRVRAAHEHRQDHEFAARAFGASKLNISGRISEVIENFGKTFPDPD